MKPLNILIVESDPIWLLSVQQMLNQLSLGTIRSATTLIQARQMMEEQLPDIVIADIVLPDGLSVELFKLFNRQLPVIFQTEYALEEFLQKAINMPNIGILVKPFGLFHLKIAIELLLSKMPGNLFLGQKGLLVTGKHRERLEIPFDAIYWIKGEGNYSIIHTVDQKYVLKRSLRKTVQDLPDQFVQTQKAYIVNINYIGHISGSMLYINQNLIPIGRTYRKQLLENIRSKYQTSIRKLGH